MKCPNCKADIMTGRAFCPVCGRKTTLSTGKAASPLQAVSRKKVSESAKARFQRGRNSVLDTFKPIIDFFSHNVWAQRVAAGIVIAVCVGTGIYMKVSDKMKYRQYCRHKRQWSADSFNTTTPVPNYCGPSPLETMFIPPPAGFDATLEYKASQIPMGWYGVKPISKTNDGRPIFAQMPVYEEVHGAFIAPVSFPMGDGRVWLPRQIEFPAAGRKRKQFCAALAKELEEANRSCQMVYSMRMVNGERLAELTEESKNQTAAWAKEKQLRDQEHQRQLDLKDRLFYHMNDNQLKHYRDGWKPVVQPIGGLQYGTPDVMVSPYDNRIYRVK